MGRNVVDTFSNPPNEVTKEIVDELSEKIETFKNKVLNLKSKIAKIQTQAEQSRKDAWQRVFFTDGNYEKIKKEVGEASSNLTDEDSKKIASAIDSYLPESYYNILKLCNLMRPDMGTQFVFVSGAPGWGKVSAIEYLIAATNAQKIVVSYSDLLKSNDVIKYAYDLLIEYRGKKEPLVLVLDEFDTIARRDDRGHNSVLINSFFDEVKKASENPDNNINLKLVVNISNMSKDQLDFANIIRMNEYLTFGRNPDYNRIIDSIAKGFNCDPAESKEDFTKNIAKHCENLSKSDKAPNARIISKAFQAAQNEWLEKNNDVKPWNAVLNSQDIIEKINSFYK